MLAVGANIERYVVERVLGEGGMAVVYLVRHRSLGGLHALKVLTVSSSIVQERLLLEGRVQASLVHPNIVQVRDVLDVNGAPGLLMEYVDGCSLDAKLARNPLPLTEAIEVFRGIVEGVAHAHEKGLAHRDLKPANVLLATVRGQLVPKVADFGLAKILESDGGPSRTRSNVSMGTPAYMAPEQVRDSKSADHRADIFALGCILYELVCGRSPFMRDDVWSTLSAVMDGRYTPAREMAHPMPEAVEKVISGCLEADRDQRLQSCADVLAVLGGGEAGCAREPASKPSNPSPPLAFPTALPPSISNETLDPALLARADARPEPVALEDALRAAGADRVVGPGGAAAAARAPSEPDPFASAIELPVRARTRSGQWVKILAAASAGGGLLILVTGALVLGFTFVIPTRGTEVSLGGDPAPATSTAAPAPAEIATAPEPATPAAPLVADAGGLASPASEPAASSVGNTAASGAPASPIASASSSARPVTAPTVAAKGTAPSAAAAPTTLSITPVTSATSATEPASAATAPAATASVTVTGDVHSVSFRGPGGTHRTGEGLAPGSYSIIADFGDGVPTPAGSISLAAGEHVTIVCSATFFNCQRK